MVKLITETIPAQVKNTGVTITLNKCEAAMLMGLINLSQPDAAKQINYQGVFKRVMKTDLNPAHAFSFVCDLFAELDSAVEKIDN